MACHTYYIVFSRFQRLKFLSFGSCKLVSKVSETLHFVFGVRKTRDETLQIKPLLITFLLYCVQSHRAQVHWAELPMVSHIHFCFFVFLFVCLDVCFVRSLKSNCLFFKNLNATIMVFDLRKPFVLFWGFFSSRSLLLCFLQRLVFVQHVELIFQEMLENSVTSLLVSRFLKTCGQNYGWNV